MDGYRDCSDGFSCGNITDVEYPFSGEDSQQVTIRYDCLSTSIPFIPPGLPSASAYRVSHLSASASHTIIVHAPASGFVLGHASAPSSVSVPASAPSPVPGPASPSARLDRPSGSTYKSAFITTESQAAMLCNWTIRVGILRSYVNGDMGNQSKMEEAMRQGFTVKSKVDTGACRECTVSGGSYGNNWMTNQSNCYCAGISTPVLGLLIIFAVFLSIYNREVIIFWKKEKTEEFDVEAFIKNFTSFAPNQYTYSHVKKMTNSFKNVIGKGGFGFVYKGTLPDGRLVAVKVLIESKGYVDADYGGDRDRRRSTSAFIFTVCDNCVSWKSQLQSQVALSIAKADYVATTAAMKEAL
nr:LEAF RUST 10 DISEASE-RESISTANCE LOCUS RECEPTOR-LIKE PROTEIN KINASE-like 2.7 [Ziziphus jujuba var. spinosa]